MELAAQVNVGHTSGGGAGDQYMPFVICVWHERSWCCAQTATVAPTT